MVPVHYSAVDNTLGEAKGRDINSDGSIDGYVIKLKSNDPTIYDSSPDRVITHEFAHTALYVGGRNGEGHTASVARDQSITYFDGIGMWSTCSKPCTFDKKAAKLIYEPTFAVGTPYSEILGTSFRPTE